MSARRLSDARAYTASFTHISRKVIDEVYNTKRLRSSQERGRPAKIEAGYTPPKWEIPTWLMRLLRWNGFGSLLHDGTHEPSGRR